VVLQASAKGTRVPEIGLLGWRRPHNTFDPGGAEFVLRDLAERVELRVGQHAGGGFGEAERDENLAGGDGVVAARLRFDRAAPRVVTRISSPAAMPSRRNSTGAKLATASGSISSSTLARRVIAPVG
jgi:hypothetical protein